MPRPRSVRLLAPMLGLLLLSSGVAATAAAAPPEGDAQFIRLATRTFDPLTLRTTTTQDWQGAYLLQVRGTLTDTQRTRLRGLGVRIGSYIPDFAYVVRLPENSRRAVEKLNFVRWIGEYRPADKIEFSMTGTGRYLVTLVETSATDQRTVAERILRLGGGVEAVSGSGQHVVATLGSGQAAEVAQAAEVLAVGELSEPGTDMANARESSGANHIEAVGGYRGQGVRGEVMDGGLRVTHQEFQARPVVMHGTNSTSTSHGTSTYGQIFASGVSAPQRGLLPEGQGIFATYNKPDRYAHTKELVDPAGQYRAVFQSNSWGGGLTTAYTSVSAELDRIVFDHDLLICQSQSNAGTQQSRPQAWAKNVLSVGGQYHYNTPGRTDDKWSGGASIGPAADGRIKPELSNYYDRIDTTSSTSNTSYTTSFGGTSGATPITCGNAGLLFQMWADGVFDGGPGKARDVFTSRPHAATAKALLINGADQFPFSGTAHDMTRTHQGWGTANVRYLHEQAKANGWKLPVLVNETDPLSTGQARKYTVTVSGTKQFKATLAYTDPAGAPSAALTRVNDLTLKVTAPDGTVYYGNNGLRAGNFSTAGGTPNTIDTVENVLLERPAAGTWTVEVLATQVNTDAHKETSATDADYALVVS